MSRVVWVLGWIGVGIWSLVCWATYAVFDLVGRFAMRNADAFGPDPDTVEGIWRLLNALHSLSTGAVLVVWALVSLLILAVPWVIDRMIGRAAMPPVSRPQPGAPSSGPAFGRDGSVIDLGPDQWSVRPTGDGRNGPVPRIGPGR